MANYGKWIGGGLGFALHGPIGLLIGLGLGTLYDEYHTSGDNTTSRDQKRNRASRDTSKGDFNVSFLVLIGAVMKADGKVRRSELDFVKSYLVQTFGYGPAKEAIRMLGDLMHQDIPIDQVSQQIARHMEYSSRLQLLHLLFGIAKADGVVAPQELECIQTIGTHMGVSTADLNSIQAMFVSDPYGPYRILEIERSATNEEVKKAYRQMAVKYHPDKVSHLGPDIQNKAKEKFQKVSEAYETIKRDRGLN